MPGSTVGCACPAPDSGEPGGEPAAQGNHKMWSLGARRDAGSRPAPLAEGPRTTTVSKRAFRPPSLLSTAIDRSLSGECARSLPRRPSAPSRPEAASPGSEGRPGDSRPGEP